MEKLSLCQRKSQKQLGKILCLNSEIKTQRSRIHDLERRNAKLYQDVFTLEKILEQRSICQQAPVSSRDDDLDRILKAKDLTEKNKVLEEIAMRL
jgi:hypothetical protein